MRLWPTAEVNGENIMLADVAALHGFDAAALERLSAVVVAPAPAAGGSTRIDVKQIRQALDGARLNLAEITILGAARCDVSSTAPRPPSSPRVDADEPSVREQEALRGSSPRPPHERTRSPRDGFLETRAVDRFNDPVASMREDSLSPDTLEFALRSHIAAWTADLGGRVDVRFGAAHRPALALRSPECRFVIRPRDATAERVGMVWFDVEVQREDKPVQVVPILAETTLLRPVVVAARVINYGQEITPRDIRVEERPFRKLGDLGVTEAAAAIGAESRRALRPGDMLRPRDLQSKPLVRRNELVTVWSRAGGVVVHSTARAMRQGWLGDVIELRAEGSESRFMGTVSGPGTVTVSEQATVLSRADGP